MSLMPLEVECQQLAAACAHGDTVVVGLGLGWLAALCALSPEVGRVTVVERDPGLIDFHRALGLFGRLPEGAGAKIDVVEGDAFTWRPAAPVDVLLIDIWQPVLGEGRIDEVRAIQANVAARVVHFWGQELEIARHAALARRPLDRAGIAATVGALGLPLAGTEDAEYAARVRGATANWIGGRWLPGTPLPVDLGELS